MKILKYILLGICSPMVYAQQLPQFSQYARNQYMINPAASGSYDFTDITVGGRYQWLGFDNSPKTGYLYVSSLVKFKKKSFNPSIRTSQGLVKSPEVGTGKLKHALGGQLIADEYGAFRKLSGAVSYAIHVPMSQSINLSFGTRAGVSSDRFMQEKARVLNQNTYGTDNEYNQFVGNQGNLSFLNLSAGLYLYSKKFFFGVSADQLTKDFVKFGSGTANINPKTYLQTTGGVHLKLNEKLTLSPSFIAKMISPKNTSVDGSVILEYNQRIWGGFSYRGSKTGVIMAGFTISDRFKFGYSFDAEFSKIRKYGSNSHELVLGIMLGR
jgi:type IX secretion system PorP/SprF family membrane protein